MNATVSQYVSHENSAQCCAVILHSVRLSYW